MQPVQTLVIQMRPDKATKPMQIQQSHVIPSDNVEIPYSITPAYIPNTPRYQTRLRTKQVHHVTKFYNQKRVFPTERTKTKTFHQMEDHSVHLDHDTDKITAETTENHIHCETTGKLLG